MTNDQLLVPLTDERRNSRAVESRPEGRTKSSSNNAETERNLLKPPETEETAERKGY